MGRGMKTVVSVGQAHSELVDLGGKMRDTGMVPCMCGDQNEWWRLQILDIDDDIYELVLSVGVGWKRGFWGRLKIAVGYLLHGPTPYGNFTESIIDKTDAIKMAIVVQEFVELCTEER
jgi:hypothetical protein